MGARKLEEAPAYLAQFALGQAAGLAGCRISQALGAMNAEVRQKALDAIPGVLAHLRSGKARKQGEASALKRLMALVESARKRGEEVAELAQQVEALQSLLNPEALLEEAVSWATAEITAEAENLVTGALNQALGSGACKLAEGGIRSAAAFMPAVQVMETARSASELIREVTLLWNSTLDFASLLDFDLVRDELVDELETALSALVSQSVDAGAQVAESFLKQKLNPAEWIKAVRRET